MSEQRFRPALIAAAVLASGCSTTREVRIDLDGYYRAVESRREAISSFSRSLAQIDARFIGCRTIDQVPVLPGEGSGESDTSLGGVSRMTLRERFRAAGLRDVEQQAAYMNYRIWCSREEAALFSRQEEDTE